MSKNAITAWGKAEDQIARKLAAISGLAYGTRMFVGDSVDIEGRINGAVFCIAGGMDQDQGWQSGATAWHTEGAFYGVFVSRSDAIACGAALLDSSAVPFTGGAGTDLPNVAKVFLRSHPRISRRLWKVSGRAAQVRAAVVECSLGVVYQE